MTLKSTIAGSWYSGTERAIREMAAGTLLAVSSDFTHYGADFSYAPHGTGGEKGS
ncbi:MAG: hypothetical protein IJP66_04790 [Kiritimatiellae bacterium]|nr:hypothetical protein [Kiritimatiellia bacterium]